MLWAYLGQGQLGLKKYDDAETSYKKSLEVDAASKKPNPAIQGLANSGLGEIYARTGKVPEANAAYDAAFATDTQPADPSMFGPNAPRVKGGISCRIQKIEAINFFLGAPPHRPEKLSFRKGGGLQAGNSESIIRRHYLDLKTATEAEEYFNILPKKAMDSGAAVIPAALHPEQSMTVAVQRRCPEAA